MYPIVAITLNEYVKKWVRAEILLETRLSYFDDIQLSDNQINEIVNYITADEIQQQEEAKLSKLKLNQKLNLTKERISKLIDMHINGKIDSETYHFMLEEYTNPALVNEPCLNYTNLKAL